MAIYTTKHKFTQKEVRIVERLLGVEPTEVHFDLILDQFSKYINSGIMVTNTARACMESTINRISEIRFDEQFTLELEEVLGE